MTEFENRLAELIWEYEPIGSGDLVKLCEKRFQWKKSTTYYGGSLPSFVAAFMDRRRLSRQQLEELKEMIAGYEEEEEL